MRKLLVLKETKLEFYLNITKESEIVKNPVPILWCNDGLYRWIPIEIVKNEIQRFLDSEKTFLGTVTFAKFHFNWYQAHRLRPDVGKMLEKLSNN